MGCEKIPKQNSSFPRGPYDNLVQRVSLTSIPRVSFRGVNNHLLGASPVFPGGKMVAPPLRLTGTVLGT